MDSSEIDEIEALVAEWSEDEVWLDCQENIEDNEVRNEKETGDEIEDRGRSVGEINDDNEARNEKETEEEIEDRVRNVGEIYDDNEARSEKGTEDEIEDRGRNVGESSRGIEDRASEYEIVSSNKGKPKLLYCGYSYHLNKKVDNIHYWSCVKKRANDKDQQCRGTTISSVANGRHILEAAAEHNHSPNVLSNYCARYRHKLKRRSKELHEVPTITIRECAKDAPLEIQTMISKSAQKKLCHRNREAPEVHPTAPVSTEDFDQIDEKYTKTLDGAPFLLGKKVTNNGVILMFSTGDNIARLAASKIWMLDGTFGTAPQGFRQIYSVLAYVGTSTSARFLPLVFFLLPSKSEETYTQALQLLSDAAEDMGQELDPDVTLTDYEKAALNAIRNLFPDCRTQGCFFHLVQNFYKHIQSNGLASLYAKDKDVYMAFKKTEALAFLPVEQVATGLELLKSTAPASMNSFFKYVEDTYVLGCLRKVRKDGSKVRSKPCFETELWNVRGNLLGDMPRTTNRLEGWHNRWRILNKANCGFYEIICNFQKEQQITNGEILKILQGLPASKRNAKEVEKDRRLKEVAMNFGNYETLNDYLLGIALVLKDN